jgi:hypothetical protein
MQDAGIFGIIEVLHPERAADIGGEDADLLRRYVENARHDRLVAGHALGRNLQRVALARLVVSPKRDARLHRHHGDAGVDDVELRHMRRAGEGRVDPGGVAVVIVERDVVGDVIVELRRAGFCGFLGIGDGGERLDIHLDGFGGVTCLGYRLRHHEGDGVADIANPV